MSKKKSELLGENFSTAAHKLRKSIMFDLIQKLELDSCYRCTLKIESIDALSIEHIESWQRSEDPVESFYSLENIAFSHLNCNVGAAYRPHKKYKDAAEYRKVNWAKHYAKNKDEVLRKKRERYHRNKHLGVV
jgi:hypothetical protein